MCCSLLLGDVFRLEIGAIEALWALGVFWLFRKGLAGLSFVGLQGHAWILLDHPNHKERQTLGPHPPERSDENLFMRIPLTRRFLHLRGLGPRRLLAEPPAWSLVCVKPGSPGGVFEKAKGFAGKGGLCDACASAGRRSLRVFIEVSHGASRACHVAFRVVRPDGLLKLELLHRISMKGISQLQFALHEKHGSSTFRVFSSFCPSFFLPMNGIGMFSGPPPAIRSIWALQARPAEPAGARCLIARWIFHEVGVLINLEPPKKSTGISLLTWTPFLGSMLICAGAPSEHLLDRPFF